MFNKSCRWLDSNPGPLVSEATALPTAPQPLPILGNCISRYVYIDFALENYSEDRGSIPLGWGRAEQHLSWLFQLSLCIILRPISTSNEKWDENGSFSDDEDTTFQSIYLLLFLPCIFIMSFLFVSLFLWFYLFVSLFLCYHSIFCIFVIISSLSLSLSLSLFVSWLF